MSKPIILRSLFKDRLFTEQSNVKSHVYSTTLAAIFCTPALCAAPTAPNGLSIDVYSNSSLELFWDRASSDVRVIGYEVIKNGNPIWLGDVTSFYDSGLDSGSSHSYEIITIDESGNRSDGSQVVNVTLDAGRLSNCSSNSSCQSISFSVSESPSTDVTQEINVPTGNALSNVTLSIYSQTSAELFWQRDNAVSSYDIYRDGVYIKRLDGISFYDPNREQGHDYKYKIVSLGINGNQLDTITVSNAGLTSPPSVSASSGDELTSSSSSSSNSGFGSSTSSSSSSSSSSTSGTSSNSSNSLFSSNGMGSSLGLSTIRVNTYSPSTGELFWDRVPGDMTYHVYKNGHLVKKTNGTSYFDSDLEDNSFYDFEIFIELDGFLHLYGMASIETVDL